MKNPHLEVRGTLQLRFESNLNKAGQRPLTIEFVGEAGETISIIGVRYMRGSVLEAMALLPGNRMMKHTVFSPAMQAAIIAARSRTTLHE